MRNPKSSSWRDAFRVIKLCVLGFSIVSVPIFAKPAFVGTREFFSIVVPWVRETLSAWLTPAFLYLILNCIIVAIVANSGVGIFNAAGAGHEDCSPSPHQREKEEKPEDCSRLPHQREKEEKSGCSPLPHQQEKEEKPKAIVFEESCAAEEKSETTINHSVQADSTSAAAIAEADTLEATWIAITEARRPPPTRQLRKADTWETHRTPNPPATDSASLAAVSKFGKSETWNSRRNLDRETVGAEMLRKEPSLGQDELNKRVEAFIAKVNHDMKLQREKSLLSYKEMVNRGSG